MSFVHKLFVREVKGGMGSGNFGHEGRPGEVGGSGGGGGGGVESGQEKNKIALELAKEELYHGSSRMSDIEQEGFRVGSGETTGAAGFYGAGIYLGSKVAAETYGRVVRVKVDVKKTLLWNSEENRQIISEVKKRLPGVTVLDPDHAKDVMKGYSRLFDLGDHKVPRMFSTVAKERGFDSVWNQETQEVVIFDPSAIRIVK